ncbi:hypothetical protein [Herbidospora daliensis]|nr:hypothetical protein [Herbidospora daliensis]
MPENMNGGIIDCGSVSLKELSSMSVMSPALAYVCAEGEPVARFQSAV